MLASTVVLGIVFSGGLITGQRLLRAEARAPMVSLSTTREAPSPGANDEAQPSLRTTFSFYEHLTNDASATPPPSAPAAAKPVVAAKPAEEAKPAEAAPVEAKPVAPAAVPAPAPTPVVAKPAAAPSVAAAAPSVAAAPAAPIAKILNEVVGSLAPSEAPVAGAAAPLPARYTLQVSSHPDRESAEQEVSHLTQMGVEPHVVVVNVPGKGELWRVRVGKFHSMDEARDFQSSLKSRRGVAGFVTPL